MENGRSWFYLAIWRGTPPEFTSDYSAEIVQGNSIGAAIHSTDAADTSVEISASFAADVGMREAVGVDIFTVTEVVWNVR